MCDHPTNRYRNKMKRAAYEIALLSMAGIADGALIKEPWRRVIKQRIVIGLGVLFPPIPSGEIREVVARAIRVERDERIEAGEHGG